MLNFNAFFSNFASLIYHAISVFFVLRRENLSNDQN